MFQAKASKECLDVVKSLMACKPKPGAFIFAFVLKMKGYFDRLESLNMVDQDIDVPSTLAAPVLTAGHNAKKIKTLCFFCNFYGNWKRSWPKYLKDLKDRKVEKDSHSGFKESRRLKHGRANLDLGNQDIMHGYALETAAHILNFVPTKKVLNIPFKMWKGKRPFLGHIKIWGCEVFIRREAQDKLEAISKKCLFVGDPEEPFGYSFYKPKDNVVFVARRGVFLEREIISKEESGSKINLEEIQESVNEEPIVNTDTQQEVVTHVKPDDISLRIHRTSDRVNKPPQFYYGFHIEEGKISDSTLSELDEPANYKEAMASPEAAKWKEAMKSEIWSMYDNQV
ncbi:retrotransposon protein, putative, ty1-copia subclass [Tanacetum coccineum]